MVGIYFFFVMTVALGSLVDCYMKALNDKPHTPIIRFSKEDMMSEGEF